MSARQGFEPKIIGFLCNWCSYAGADLAGVSRIQYPANLRIIRVMCSGRVEPEMVLKAFSAGADGVLISGCHPGDCHYKEGNFKALRRKALLEALLPQFGIEKERLLLTWVSASEGERFAEVVRSLVAQIKSLGPLGGFRPRHPAEAPDHGEAGGSPAVAGKGAAGGGGGG
ncbi:MAG: hydrogenase iron-sulfur subunit [Acetobacteraceae bacterium]|nr:hydrogenase iron-sulfur subunit [Acetobacteraceae bacterium]